MDFVEAIESLAQSLGLDVPYEQGSCTRQARRVGLEAMYQAMEQSAQYFETQLKQTPQAIDYLKNRGISGQTAKTFAIGYAPPGWNNLSGDEKLLVSKPACW